MKSTKRNVMRRAFFSFLILTFFRSHITIIFRKRILSQNILILMIINKKKSNTYMITTLLRKGEKNCFYGKINFGMNFEIVLSKNINYFTK